MRSIRRRLLAYVLTALSVGAGVLLVVSYLVALDEIDELFDENLKQVALAVATYQQTASGAGMPRSRRDLPALPAALEAGAASDFVTAVWAVDGSRRFSSAPEVRLPFVASTGHSTAVVGDEVWRVYSIVSADGVAQAAQRESSNAALAAESALALIPPLIALLVLIAVLLTVALRRGLQPLGTTTMEIARRSADSLQPIDERAVPPEIRPLVASINALMRRLADAFAARHRFIADAAHELRSPLTALRLQLQLLERAPDDAARRSASAELKFGIERAQRLVEQLLDLSRVEAEAPRRAGVPLDLSALVREAIAAASIEAEHRGIDLGADADAPLWAHGDAHELALLLGNLIGNALRYSAPGGRVDVRTAVDAGRPVVSVTDAGPGIAPAERAAVFERFHRGEAGLQSEGSPGSGLGLAICRAIADRHAASIELGAAARGSGLAVRVVFPPAGANEAPSITTQETE